MWSSLSESTRKALLAELRQKQIVVVTTCPADAGRALAEALAATGRAVTTWAPGAVIDVDSRDVLLVADAEKLLDGELDQRPLLVRAMEWMPTVVGLACSGDELAAAPQVGVFHHAGGAQIRMDLYQRLMYPPPVPFAEAAAVFREVFGEGA